MTTTYQSTPKNLPKVLGIKNYRRLNTLRVPQIRLHQPLINAFDLSCP